MRKRLLLQKERALQILSAVDRAISERQILDLDPLEAEARELMFKNFEDGIKEISFYDITEYIDFVRRNFKVITDNNGAMEGDLTWIKEYKQDIDDDLKAIV